MAPSVERGELRSEIERILRVVTSFMDRRCRATGELSCGVGTCHQAAAQIVELVGTQPPPDHVPEPPSRLVAPGLARLAATLQLGRCEYDALILAAACELVPRLGRVLAHLNDHASLTRPTVGLALELAAGGVPSATELCGGALVRNGLVLVDGDGPLVERELRVRPEVLELLAGRDPAADTSMRLDELVLPPDVRDRAEAWSALPATPLVIAGTRGRGRRTLARAIAGRVGRCLVARPLHADEMLGSLHAARRDARWHGALLLLQVDSDLDPNQWRRIWSELADLGLPCAVSVDEHDAAEALESSDVEPTLLRLAAPAVSERQQLWRAMLPRAWGVDSETSDALGTHFRFPPGRIAAAIRRAGAASASSIAQRLFTACREIGRTSMGPLAERLPLPFTRDDLVVPSQVRDELDLALAWVRHESLVQGTWGFRERLATGRGLVAMFSGPPGTGKTMAAQVMAAELGLDVYRIDLSRVVSKWIGETEKHLARLFDEAHHAGVMLFFDEAEALFGKRSAVKEAQDRYANIEVGYLLQRIETYEGIVILASNRASDLDPAFFRRIHVNIEFPLPGAIERQRIWSRAFPAEAALAADAAIGPIAERIALSGGEIRNAALAAAYRAAAAGDPITTGHLAWAVKREVLRSGRVINRQDWVGIGLEK